MRHSETAESRHNFITVPIFTPEDKVVSNISKFNQELAAIPSPSSNHHLTAIKQLQTMFSKCKNNEPSITINTDEKDTMTH